MKPFIYHVAKDLIERLGNNLRDVTIIFPNKRAGLFLNQQFATVTDKPVWAPKYRTISDIFQSLTPLTRCDDIMAVCELHKAYSQHIEDPETLDNFYGWGEIMLSDFDDIDKHMADAEKIFSNIYDIKEMDDNQFLTEHQIQTLQRFFHGFDIQENTLLKQRFLSLWNVMYSIYCDFNKQLEEKGLAYEGAIYRKVAESLKDKTEETQKKTYAIVGFNVLNEVEKALFHHLQRTENVLFYWDYDVAYIQEDSHHEAGEFIRRNLLEFGSALPDTCFDHMKSVKEIEFIATNTENVQARYIPEWLKDHLTNPEQDTAVVLCNESLLQPVLHSLPEKGEEGCVQHTNITMGFPLSDTPIYSFLHTLLQLQTSGYDTERKRFRNEQKRLVEQHPIHRLLADAPILEYQDNNRDLLLYMKSLSERIAVAYSREEDKGNDLFQQMYNEGLYKAHQVIQRFLKMEEDGMLAMERSTLKNLIINVLKSVKIPFHGEPAYGLQIMGVLETRNLNFKNILMLSVNEGKMPKNATDTSFIPYHLKKAFGLTTVEHKIAVYAFYFYRLLQRAERITYMYNTANGMTSKNEMSRFLRQLLAETDMPIRMRTIKLPQEIQKPRVLEVAKTQEIMDQMWANYRGTYKNGTPRLLSPSAINTYINCSMKFYFQQIARLRVEKDPEDGLDAALFGTIFHESAENIYKALMERNQYIRKQDIDTLLKKEEIGIMPHIEKAFLKNFFDNNPKKVFYNGQLLIAKKVIARYIIQLLKYELKSVDLIIKDMEKAYYREVKIKTNGTEYTINVGGKIDKMDYVKTPDSDNGNLIEILRITDYKTGGKAKTPQNMDAIFATGNNRADYIFQAFLYSWVMTAYEKRPIAPMLFYVNNSSAADYDPSIQFNGSKVTDFNALSQEFESRLKELLENHIFNADEPFQQTSVKENCKFCDFKKFCGRQETQQK